MYDLMSRDGVKFIIERVIANANEVMEERRKDPDNEYLAGKAQAFYETLDIIKNELSVRNENLSDYSLSDPLEKRYY